MIEPCRLRCGFDRPAQPCGIAEYLTDEFDEGLHTRHVPHFAVVVRSPVAPPLPQVPTMAEAGFEQAQYHGWTGLGVPAGTPAPIVERLAREIAAILDSAAGRDFLNSRSAERYPLSPRQFAEAIRAEYVKWGAVIQETGIRIPQ